MTLGMKLLQAREAAGLSIEEVANILRMRLTLVRAMESDDLTSFSHPSYARLSLLDYTRFLRIPTEEIRDWLPDIGGPSIDGCNYLDNFSELRPAARRQEMLDKEKSAQNPLTIVIRIILLVVILGLLAAGYVLYRNLGRISAPSESGRQGQVMEVIVEEAVPPQTESTATQPDSEVPISTGDTNLLSPTWTSGEAPTSISESSTMPIGFEGDVLVQSDSLSLQLVPKTETNLQAVPVATAVDPEDPAPVESAPSQ